VSGNRGRPSPLGVTLEADGANIAVFSRHGTSVSVCLFDAAGETEMVRFVLPQRSGDIHFGFIQGLTQGARYGLRVEGPWEPHNGHRFDPSKLLIDPYAAALDCPFKHDPLLAQFGVDTAHIVPKCIVQGELPDAERLPSGRLGFIYEIPVKAFTMLHQEVKPDKRGTIGALAEPAIINHFRRLGVDTVELMPIAAWIDERHLPPLGLSNVWGYNPVNFFAADPNLAPGGLLEVRKTVAALHEAGIRVVLDVVFNHTGESDEFGPTLCLRGVDNASCYAHSGGALINDTGCGNTLALSEPAMGQMVLDALRHWVLKAGIDGFRFDLATVMGRGVHGFSPLAPLLAAIERDPLLSSCIMIAEPWDLGPGGYQLGNFPARWHEWNDRYRDDVRKFWRGDAHSANGMATRLAGSSDVFAPARKPSCSINFLSAHDGFTLRDVVTYTDKDNFNNGEDNRDGKSGEVTWPGGDVRALLATLFLSRGTPMLTAGDEFGRTQKGNNNAYAQDNEVTWLDWSGRDDGLVSEVATLVSLRRTFAALTDDAFLQDKTESNWFGAHGEPVNWSNPGERFVGLVLSHAEGRIAVVLNGSRENHKIQVRTRDGYRWNRLYCSSRAQDCPSRSVSLFQEISKTPGLAHSHL
jgi:glycogen debranching enzyme